MVQVELPGCRRSRINKPTTKLSLVLQTIPFVLRLVHLLASLICENIKVRGQFPRMFVFVLRIEEAGFKKSNKCLWKRFCPLSFMTSQLQFLFFWWCIYIYIYVYTFFPFFFIRFIIIISCMAWYNWQLPEEFLQKLRLSLVVLSDTLKKNLLSSKCTKM